MFRSEDYFFHNKLFFTFHKYVKYILLQRNKSVQYQSIHSETFLSYQYDTCVNMITIQGKTRNGSEKMWIETIFINNKEHQYVLFFKKEVIFCF